VIKYEDIKKMLFDDSARFEEQIRPNGNKAIVVLDNADIWFYFDESDVLISIRAY
jgi:hypothetical protein